MLLAAPSHAIPWTRIPLPPHVEYFTAMTAGSRYLFASMVDSSGAYMGLFRTPLESPGSWESIGQQGLHTRKIIVGGDDDSSILVPNQDHAPDIIGSTDGGATWVPRDSGIEDDQWIYTMGSNGDFPGFVYGSARMEGGDPGVWIYRSTDFGASWTKWTLSDHVWGVFQHFAVPRNHSATAYSLSYTGFNADMVYVTRDGGITWDRSDPGWPPDAIPIDFDCFDQTSPSYLFMPTIGSILDWWYNGMYAGYVFPPFDSGGQIGSETALWAPGIVFVAGVDQISRLGVAYATPSLQWGPWTMLQDGFRDTWHPLPYENPDKYQFVAAHHTARLFLSVWRDGLWMRDVSDVMGVGGPAEPILHLSCSPPWPNPTRDGASFFLSGPASKPIPVEIVDVQGRMVSRLQAEPGKLLRWNGLIGDGHPAPAGIYYLRAGAAGEEARSSVVIAR
jgi:hypothetical protein